MRVSDPENRVAAHPAFRPGVLAGQQPAPSRVVRGPMLVRPRTITIVLVADRYRVSQKE